MRHVSNLSDKEYESNQRFYRIYACVLTVIVLTGSFIGFRACLDIANELHPLQIENAVLKQKLKMKCSKEKP